MEAELFHVDGQTDMTRLMATFRNVANIPKNEFFFIYILASFISLLYLSNFGKFPRNNLLPLNIGTKISNYLKKKISFILIGS